MTFLTVSGLTRRYGAVVALSDVSFDVARGSRTAIFGPSGSGKTTLLRLIAGFDNPDAGTIAVEGEVLAYAGGVVPAHLRGIGFVPQDGALFPHLTIADNIGFGLDRKLPGRSTRILELMGMVELPASMSNRRPHQLSGGQQQRVALARALARSPKLMLLDEPFSSLDLDLRAAMRNVVAAILSATGTTALFVTHDRTEALSFADHIAVFDGGRLVRSGTSKEIYWRPPNERAARFLGDAIILDATSGDSWVDCILGRIPIVERGRTGRVRIMLRPEQLRLRSPEGGESPIGKVVRIEFGGSLCRVHIVFDGGPTIVTAAAATDLPEIGSRVGLDIVGAAHVFAASPDI